MAITNHERVGKALELLKDGLAPFVERELAAHYGKYWLTRVTEHWSRDLSWPEGQQPHLDVAAILKVFWEQWNEVFRKTLGHAERSLVSELREVRNKWAHQAAFSGDDTYRALDSAARLLTAISAPQATETDKMKQELLRVRYDEQVRSEKRKSAGTAVESKASGYLKAWREVVHPHRDVASGRYQQAEFAADLWQVHLGEVTDEYRNPVEFFRRTYLTESLQAAYPIHPEVFDRLYTDWSTLAKFQRTRGVLRLMAAVIHSLWEKGDRNPLIMPSTVPIDDPRVQFELTRYLSDNWVPVIARDVDGPNSLPQRIDLEAPNLGRLAACRRVARTIYLGSAPTPAAANRGLEDRRIKLGCVMPGEAPAVFGDALRRLAAAATYLYQDGPRFWYSTQPTVTKLAEDRAEQLKRDPDAVAKELDVRLRKDVQKRGDFSRVHPLPQLSQEVPDDLDARLVVLGIDYPYGREANSPALAAAKGILEMRGNVPRLYRNTLVFLAVDRTRLQDLDEATRRYLAWKSILAEKEGLDLSPHQVRQAEAQLSSAETTLLMRLPEAYQWLLVPVQLSPQGAVEWQPYRFNGQEALAERASRKLRGDDQLVTSLAATPLRMELDRIPLWRGDHVSIRQLVEDFARYLYLPRLKGPEVLLAAMREGLALLTWEQDSFAYAEDYDEASGRYRGLRCGQRVAIPDSDAPGLLVKPEVARRQLDREKGEQTPTGGNGGPAGTAGSLAGQYPLGTPTSTPGTPSVAPVGPARPKRFHGSVELDAARVGRDAGRIAEEVIVHLEGLVGAKVKVTLEIEAEIPSGAPDNVVRTVTENSQTLKFISHGFEKE